MDSQNNPVQIKDFADQNTFQIGEEVDLTIKSQTDLGYKAIINQSYWGVLYQNEVFQELYKNQELKGYIKKIRDDGRIDLTLYQTGHKAALPIEDKILNLLKDNNGFFPITDKTSPEDIYRYFEVSKKKYKIALGGLYKKRLIQVLNDGIKLSK